MQNNKRNSKIYYIFRIVIVVIIAIAFFLGTRPAKVTIDNNIIKISGLYGVELRAEDVTHLELREVLPNILARTNGMDLFGIAQRGIYKLEELGRTRLISFSDGGPFILMQTGSEWIVINYKNSEETESLYNELTYVIKD